MRNPLMLELAAYPLLALAIVIFVIAPGTAATILLAAVCIAFGWIARAWSNRSHEIKLTTAAAPRLVGADVVEGEWKEL